MVCHVTQTVSPRYVTTDVGSECIYEPQTPESPAPTYNIERLIVHAPTMEHSVSGFARCKQLIEVGDSTSRLHHLVFHCHDWSSPFFIIISPLGISSTVGGVVVTMWIYAEAIQEAIIELLSNEGANAPMPYGGIPPKGRRWSKQFSIVDGGVEGWDEAESHPLHYERLYVAFQQEVTKVVHRVQADAPSVKFKWSGKVRFVPLGFDAMSTPIYVTELVFYTEKLLRSEVTQTSDIINQSTPQYVPSMPLQLTVPVTDELEIPSPPPSAPMTEFLTTNSPRWQPSLTAN